MKNPYLEICNRLVGIDYEPLVVVEIGINHEGSLKTAKELVLAAKAAGAEVIKHQTHIPDAEMSIEAQYVIPGNTNESIYDVISRCSLSAEEEFELADYVNSLDLIYISTPFSFEAIEVLNDIGIPAFKIGSGECNNYPFVKKVAEKGKPVILSTGMNSISSIRPSVEILREEGVQFALLHCTNLYPTPDNLIRLDAIRELGVEFSDAVLGLSDHSLSNYPCLGSVALGASILERHFTDSKLRPGPDIICSMTPSELEVLIEGSKVIWKSSRGSKRPLPEENVTIKFAFSSVVARRCLEPGHIITLEDITLKRPAGGDFGPKDYFNLIGRRVSERIEANTQVKKRSLASG